MSLGKQACKITGKCLVLFTALVRLWVFGVRGSDEDGIVAVRVWMFGVRGSDEDGIVAVGDGAGNGGELVQLLLEVCLGSV